MRAYRPANDESDHQRRIQALQNGDFEGLRPENHSATQRETPDAPNPLITNLQRGLQYATVHKTRVQGRVRKIDFRIVFGQPDRVQAALQQSRCSNKINTAFVERQNGTDRNRNARKVRKTYCFSKDWDVHQAVTYFTMFSYNFCWPVRTLRVKGRDGRWRQQTPAMAAGLTDHVWTLSQWLKRPTVPRK